MSKHRQIIAALVFAIVLVGGVLAFHITEKKPAEEQAATATVTRPELEIDTDQDGLKDWEEDLWQTDKKNQDTDGDGTTDGREVANDRNPRVKGPNDSLYEGKEVATSSEPKTETDKFARTFFARYIAVKEQGGEFDAETQADLINTTLNELDETVEFTPNTKENIKITPNKDQAAYKAYGNAIGMAIVQSFTSKNKNEVAILQDSLQMEDEAQLKQLAPIIREYKAYEARLKTIPVPEPLTLAHLTYLDGITELIAILESFEKAFTDPISMLFGVKQYPYALKRLYDATSVLIAQLQYMGATYTSTEPGYALISLTNPAQ